MSFRSTAALVALLAIASGCSSSSSSSPAADTDAGEGAQLDAVPTDTGAADTLVAAETPDEGALVAARPYSIVVPKGYDSSKSTPMILLLHGYSATGAVQLGYFQFEALANSKTIFVAYPDGLPDKQMKQYWNATDACCDLDHNKNDDVAYLTAVVHDAQKKYNLDPKRIFVVGHSNGGFMTHRLGCERSDLFAAGVSLAGAQWNDVTKCKPSRPFPIAEVHGDADDTILFGGGNTTQSDGTKVPYPSVATTVSDWAKLDGCAGAPVDTGMTLDLDGNVTTVSRSTGCKAAGAVELWKIAGAGHIPGLTVNWGEAVYTFLMAHPMP
ncbi:MAG: alpha/beta hydrolase family esterase [Polyangiales bacterium]